mmetsp:Transcript_10264/g.19227  ORF Transcript_10264/g.19227 Transcript_10264/m.19227 type:complete len:459 (+) Transcript_10264:171-1547(+)
MKSVVCFMVATQVATQAMILPRRTIAPVRMSSFYLRKKSTTFIINHSSKSQILISKSSPEDQDGESSMIGMEDDFRNDNYDAQLPPDFGLKSSLPESQYTQVLYTNDLQHVAERLRQVYDDHFRDPRQPNANRFVWDPWCVSAGDDVAKGNYIEASKMDSSTATISNQVPGEDEATLAQTQYSLKRIQCNNFFTEKDFSTLVEELTLLGRSIGLTAITPPWMSMYTNGDLQNFHTDAPHGPMAFVLSLCKENHFLGGETMMLRPNIMDMWRGFDGSVGLEAGQILRHIPPTPLGKFIAFDPRVPHGVNRVTGIHGNGNDPRYARVVVHGWFSEPEVCWFGPWEEDSGDLQVLLGMLDETLEGIVEILDSGEIGRVVGYLACKLDIDEDGEVVNLLGVCDTLQADWEDYRGIIGYDEADRPVMEDATSDVKLTIYENLKNLNFGSGKKDRSIVVPFLFE